MSVLIKGMEKPKSCTWWDGKCPLLGDDDDCKLQDCQEEWTWQDQYKGCPLSDVPDTNVGDIISRQAAIDTSGLDEEIRCEMCKNPMHTNRGCDGNCKYDEKLYERIIQILNKRIKPLPSAQPERKTGKWIDGKRMKNDGTFYWFRQCDQCGYERNDCDTEKDSNFCPNCGADMREGQDD